MEITLHLEVLAPASADDCAIRARVSEDFPPAPPHILQAGQHVVVVPLTAVVTAPQQQEPFLTDATPGERLLLQQMQGWRGFDFDHQKCLNYIRQLAVDYPSLDMLAVAKEMSAWLLDNKKQKGGLVRYRRFCSNAKEWGHHSNQTSQQEDLDDPLAWTRETN